MQSDTHSFIVRISCEALGDEGKADTWRGSIEHVGSDQRLYFQDLKAIVRFIKEQTGIDARKSGSLWKTLLARIGHGTL